MLKVYQVNIQEREMDHNWTCLSTKYFLAKVFPIPLSNDDSSSDHEHTRLDLVLIGLSPIWS